MEKYDLHKEEIKIHNIVYAITSPNDYEMSRYLLLEDMPDCEYDEYVIVEGWHCSCYCFDETRWEAIKYTKKELNKIAETRIKDKCYDVTEQALWNYIYKILIRGEENE